MDATRLRLDRPCPFRLCELEFDERGNCTACGLKVVDLSAGTEEDTEAFLAGRTGACIAYLVDAGGRVLFGRAALSTGLALAAGAAAAIAPQLEPGPPGSENPSAVAESRPEESNHILRAMEEARARFAVEPAAQIRRPVHGTPRRRLGRLSVVPSGRPQEE